MATYIGGDKNVVNREYVTAGANLAGKTLVTAAGAVASSAGTAYGVVSKDTPSGDLATVKNGAGSFLEIVATGVVTAGTMVEALQSTIYANINGTSTSVTMCGVSTIASGYPVGLAHSTGVSGDTVLIEWFSQQAKTA